VREHGGRQRDKLPGEEAPGINLRPLGGWLHVDADWVLAQKLPVGQVDTGRCGPNPSGIGYDRVRIRLKHVSHVV
jgi:hypothetical protein